MFTIIIIILKILEIISLDLVIITPNYSCILLWMSRIIPIKSILKIMLACYAQDYILMAVFHWIIKLFYFLGHAINTYVAVKLNFFIIFTLFVVQKDYCSPFFMRPCQIIVILLFRIMYIVSFLVQLKVALQFELTLWMKNKTFYIVYSYVCICYIRM